MIVDNTNPCLEDRAALILIGRQYQVKRVIGYHFRSTVQQSIERNALRVGKAFVPRVAIFSTSKAFVSPMLGEGFDELYEVLWGPNNTFIKARV